MRFLPISIILAFVFFQANAQNNLNQTFKNFAKIEDFKTASIGLIAIDVKSGETIAELNQNLSLIPASTQKIITTATALEIFGKEQTFSTRILYSGFIDSAKVLQGNIIIKGGGDPALGSKYFKNKYSNFLQTWADTIKNLGIDSINGKIIGDDSYFSNRDVPSTWIWEDIGNYYGAFASGLSIYDNAFEINFAPNTEVNVQTKISKITPQVPNLEIENNVKTSIINKDLAYVYGTPFQNTRRIEGTIPKTSKEFKIKGSIPNPTIVVQYQLQSYLEKIGVNISKFKNTKDSIVYITKTESPKISEIIKITNLKSNNLFAEHIALHVGKHITTKSDYKSSSKAIKDFWKRKISNTDGMYIYDGSGLSRSNAITAKQMSEVLMYMSKSNNFEAFYSSLPTAGISGTLSRMCINGIAKSKVHAKSGTLSRVRNYAGYLTTLSGKEIAFVVFLNNFNCSSAMAKKHIEKLFNEMVQN